MCEQPKPFTLRVADEAISDLAQRLAKTRLPDQAPGTEWTTGTELAWMEDLLAYWRDKFDWRAEEARLNALPQFTVPIDGIDLHFLHVPGNGPAPLPLLLLHGWPGSVFEFLELIPRLTGPARFGGDPADALTVIAPSLPGFGLSFAPGQRRFDGEAMADCLTELMTDVLGYQRFAIQGGDWGCFIGSRIACDRPDLVVGLHLNLLPLRRDPGFAPADPTTEEEVYLDQLAAFLQEDTGYQWIQGTRPQTLAYALTDSPAGLAAWIAEKFRAWSDCDGDISTVIPLDRLLANIALYWFTGAIGSSFWPYYARFHGSWPIPNDATIDVPMGYAEFPKETVRAPRSLAERVFTDIRRWQVMPRGGHFPALEQPEALAGEITAFLAPLRS